ncbi:putative metalloprotease CJM1_0395 family protein [Labrenzia sp. CE80]|uniref:putative metalloprotease CJM1_0395 family protein n=1 Tax=Labrenzia sp. CE80 TaxID=1788986 RepID=UPI001930F9AB|nr:putative metalloprotease CJM1_0395 family protein [Labrenzia sp. CE80]
MFPKDAGATLILMLSVISTFPAQTGLRGTGAVRGQDENQEKQQASQVVQEEARSSVGRSQAAARAGAVSPLSSEAVLALQLVDDTQSDSKRGGGTQGSVQSLASPSEGTAGTADNPDDLNAGSASDQEDAGGASGRGQNAVASPGVAQSSSSGEAEEDPDGDGLTEAEEKQVEELKQRDREVRAHEQAHARVGGPYAGAPTYTFQQGPDGGRYAIGGEVQIDTSVERTAEATIRKMQIVIRAATAPAEPSSQDLKVAQQARSQLAAAQAEARAEAAEELSGDDETSGPGNQDVANADTVQPTAPSASEQADTGPGRDGSDEQHAGDNERSADARKDAERAFRLYQAASDSLFGLAGNNSSGAGLAAIA